MDNNLLQVAFAVSNSPGVFALLLGSGVSRSAEIPTGWDITNDLIDKIATIEGVTLAGKFDEWYQKKYGKEPRYDDLLRMLAATTDERSALLRGYFEPTDEERENKKKLPQEAHKAIATLVKKGFIKVILTTNFDRLIELALEEVGITPYVISTTDMIKGALPLTHSPITIIKLHGDYRDGRVKNTDEELSQYDPEVNKLLDQVFDEYGLIISGWSATWDKALRDALLRKVSRRFSIYWTARGTPSLSTEANEMVTAVGAQLILVDGADEFFKTLSQNVDALATLPHKHPMSAAIAVERTKKLMQNPLSRIDLEDFVISESNHAFELVRGAKAVEQLNEMPIRIPDEYPIRWDYYFERMEILLSILGTVCFYGQDEHIRLVRDVLEGWAHFNAKEFLTAPSLELSSYAFLIYVCGISAVFKRKWHWLSTILNDINTKITASKFEPVFDAVVEYSLNVYHIPGTPLAYFNSYLYQKLAPFFRSLIPYAEVLDNNFDLFELTLSLVHEKHRGKLIINSGIADTRSYLYVQNFFTSNEVDLMIKNLFSDKSDIFRENLRKYQEDMERFQQSYLHRIPKYEDAFLIGHPITFTMSRESYMP